MTAQELIPRGWGLRCHCRQAILTDAPTPAVLCGEIATKLVSVFLAQLNLWKTKNCQKIFFPIKFNYFFFIDLFSFCPKPYKYVHNILYRIAFYEFLKLFVELK